MTVEFGWLSAWKTEVYWWHPQDQQAPGTRVLMPGKQHGAPFRGGEVVTRKAHNLEIAGANPVPETVVWVQPIDNQSTKQPGFSDLGCSRFYSEAQRSQRCDVQFAAITGETHGLSVDWL